MDTAAARAFYAEESWGNRWAIKGPLYDPVTGHKGLDIAAAGRAIVPALRPGRVAAIYRHPVIGWVIAIEHAAGDIDGYCHVTQPLVAVGDRIDQWDDLARVATWGNYTGSAWRGPHIHLVNAATVQRIHMGPTRDPAPIIRAQLLALAGGGTTPIDPEEDDMPAPRIRQAHWDRPDGSRERLLYSFDNGLAHRWVESGATIANRYAKDYDTQSSEAVTESMFREIRRACEAVAGSRTVVSNAAVDPAAVAAAVAAALPKTITATLS